MATITAELVGFGERGQGVRLPISIHHSRTTLCTGPRQGEDTARH